MEIVEPIRDLEDIQFITKKLFYFFKMTNEFWGGV